jgi:ABC-type cobalamin/Fe3+-siderophores transport system ATPase subunit
VIIGRNGVGKTHLLESMTQVISNPGGVEKIGQFIERYAGGARLGLSNFANLVSVTFSAFDPFEPVSKKVRDARDIPYSYIGLKKIRTAEDGPNKPVAPKDHTALAREFSLSLQNVMASPSRLLRWRKSLETLEADPVFKEAEVSSIAVLSGDKEAASRHRRDLFWRLSSGHKIVLLTMTRLVETVEERSLVLIDEPEAHLHPPLLAAFARALSDLLFNRNGVAIIATHSPVLLQEVPSSCVWMIRRSHYARVAERPRIQTFGENVGVLTSEVFGLEVSASGFHKMLSDAVLAGLSYEQVLDAFNGQLGGEAKAIARALYAERTSNQ